MSKFLSCSSSLHYAKSCRVTLGVNDKRALCYVTLQQAAAGCSAETINRTHTNPYYSESPMLRTSWNVVIVMSGRWKRQTDMWGYARCGASWWRCGDFTAFGHPSCKDTPLCTSHPSTTVLPIVSPLCIPTYSTIPSLWACDVPGILGFALWERSHAGGV